jgi:hypothetical protein
VFEFAKFYQVRVDISFSSKVTCVKLTLLMPRSSMTRDDVERSHYPPRFHNSPTRQIRFPFPIHLPGRSLFPAPLQVFGCASHSSSPSPAMRTAVRPSFHKPDSPSLFNPHLFSRLMDIREEGNTTPEEIEALRMECSTWALLQAIMPCI